MKISFVVIGKPQGKARPRVCRVGGKSITYTPKKTVEYERMIKESYTSVSRAKFPKNLPLEMKISAYFPIPKSTTKKYKNEALDGKIFPTKKPDSDNIIKSICDALNDVAFVDDSQVCRIYFEKKYAEIPHIKVDIKDIEED